MINILILVAISLVMTSLVFIFWYIRGKDFQVFSNSNVGDIDFVFDKWQGLSEVRYVLKETGSDYYMESNVNLHYDEGMNYRVNRKYHKANQDNIALRITETANDTKIVMEDGFVKNRENEQFSEIETLEELRKTIEDMLFVDGSLNANESIENLNDGGMKVTYTNLPDNAKSFEIAIEKNNVGEVEKIVINNFNFIKEYEFKNYK